MTLQKLRLKKGEDRRIRSGHPWVFSNEVNTTLTPLKNFQPGEEVVIEAHDASPIGIAYVNPHSLITARIISSNSKDRLTPAFFQEKIVQALTLRERMFNCPYYRLVFSEGDNLPGLVIDRFHNDFVVQTNTAGMDLHQQTIAQVLRDIIPDTQSILLRNDSPIRLQEGLTLNIGPLHGQPPSVVMVEENGVKFSVPFSEGQKTGWFYDHRQNRARLKAYAKDQSVLDVFSYVGGFGVQAAAFGAKQVNCIDSSALACDFIKKNADLNQVANKVTAICDDAFDGMKSLIESTQQYDVIIVDPPAFVKKAKDHKTGLAAYQRINELAIRLLAPNGILFSCSCSMQVSQDELWQVIKRAAFRSQAKLQLLERGHQGLDHPIHLAVTETDYLKAFILRKIT